jgi:hypothetical protein
MRKSIVTACLLHLGFLTVLVSGCAALLYRYHPVTIQAIDAETKKPIVGAYAEITYPNTQPHRAPYLASGSTGDNGIAELKATGSGIYCARLDISAKGYMHEDEDLSLDAIEAADGGTASKASKASKPTFVMELFAEPRPQLELIIPDGTVGPIRVNVHIQDDFVYPAGQRDFRYPVVPPEVTQIILPPMFRHVSAAAFSGRFANGTELHATEVDTEVGFWWVGAEGDLNTYFVGSPLMCRQYQRQHPTTFDGQTSSRSSSSSSSGGKRGRRN